MHKENEKVPSFVFIIHPRDWSDLGRPVAAALRLDPRLCVRIFSFAPLRFFFGSLFLLGGVVFPRLRFVPCTPRGFDAAGAARGYIVSVTLSAWQMKQMMKREFTRRLAYRFVASAIRYAEKKYGVVRAGLGAISAPLAKGGLWPAEDRRIGAKITHGDTLTGVFTVRILSAADELFSFGGFADKTVAVVGASGLVGSVATRQIAREFSPKKMILIAHRNRERLAEIKEALFARDNYRGEVELSLSVASIAAADVVILTTTAPGDIVSAQILKDGALVVDMAQPINMSERIWRACLSAGKKVYRVDGGFVNIPGVKLKFPLGPPPGTTFACLVETMVETMDGLEGDYVGIVDDMDFARELLARAERRGFVLAPLTNFGRVLEKNSKRK